MLHAFELVKYKLYKLQNVERFVISVGKNSDLIL